MNLERFLKQSVAHERKTGQTDWGDSTFGEPEALPARVEAKQRRVRSASGDKVLATTRVMLGAEPEVFVGDRIDGLDVVARESIVDVRGRILGWTVYL